jgi:FkbM family methyltransferase
VFTSYAQFQEDVVLFRALSGVTDGFYVDVGAYEPEQQSVTKAFYDRGWHGINIEPVPGCVARLQASRPRDINLALAASDKVGEILLHQLEGTGLSTVVERFAARGEARGFNRKSHTVETDTLERILDRHAPADIHFLKVDVEGAEASVLGGANFRRHRPWIVLVEATEPQTQTPSHAEWEPILLSAGYTFTLEDGLNRWYVADEHPELVAATSFTADHYEKADDVHRLRVENTQLLQQLARFREHPVLKPALHLRRGVADLRRRLFTPDRHRLR